MDDKMLFGAYLDSRNVIKYKVKIIQFFPDSTHQLKSSATRVGASNIEKARPYYEALDVSNKAQKECQSAATNYQRASGIHAAAKETIALAEARFTEKKSSITNLEQGSIEFIPPDTLNNISETDSAISGGDQCPLLFDR